MRRCQLCLETYSNTTDFEYFCLNPIHYHGICLHCIKEDQAIAAIAATPSGVDQLLHPYLSISSAESVPTTRSGLCWRTLQVVGGTVVIFTVANLARFVTTYYL